MEGEREREGIIPRAYQDCYIRAGIVYLLSRR